MFTLLTLLACTPPKITLDTAIGSEDAEDGSVDDDQGGGADDTGGGEVGDDDGSGGDDGDDTGAGGDDGDDTGIDGDDTGIDGDDTGDTGDTAEPEPEPDPVPDYSVWLGTRTIIMDGCTEEIEEEGFLLDEDWEFADYLGELEAACPECTHFYEIETSPGTVCDWIGVDSPIYRGIALDEGSAYIDVYTLDSFFVTEDYYWIWADMLSENSPFDGWSIEYDYDDWFGYIIYEGLVEFPETYPEE